ncbi:hypothetical protein M413DRAFT_63181, partial [Hebeloma cylindrosporum]
LTIHQSELSGENAEVYLFQWLSSTDKKLGIVPIGDLKPQQGELERVFIKIISAAELYPAPGRVIRNLVGRCLVTLYMRAETRTMFDTLQAFLRLVGDFRSVDRDVVKMCATSLSRVGRCAAFSCIGDLMAVFGSNVMSFMAEICVVTIKTYRSSNSSLLRYHALIALYKSLTTAKRAVTDATCKDILKQMRTALTDKSLPVQRAASQVLVAMHSSSDASILSLSELDSIITQSVKSLETADQATRHSHAQLIGHLLASTQIERVVPPPETSQKSKKDSSTGEQQDDDPSPSSTAEITKPMLTPTGMFTHLSAHLNKQNITRKTRIGIFDFYAALLTKLGASFVETNFSLIVSHLVTEIVSSPRSATNRYDILLTRSLVGILLRDLVGVRMLSEQGQISAIQELANAYLKRWPAMMPGQVAPSSQVLVVALREVAGLLQQLGNAPPPVQNALAEPLVSLLSHPSHTVRVTAAWALRCFCYSTPLRLPKTILTVMDKLQRDLASILTPGSSTDIPLRALGHAYGLAALVSIIPQRPLYVSYDVSAKVLDMATQLLKRAGEHDVKIAGIEVEVTVALMETAAFRPAFRSSFGDRTESTSWVITLTSFCTPCFKSSPFIPSMPPISTTSLHVSPYAYPSVLCHTVENVPDEEAIAACTAEPAYPSGLANRETTDWSNAICVASGILEKPSVVKHWCTLRRRRASRSRRFNPFFATIGAWVSAGSSTFAEIKLLAKDNALLRSDAIRRATSSVTNVEALFWRKHRMAPRALSRTCRRNSHSGTDRPAFVAVSLLVGFGSALRQRTSNCGRCGLTKFGPSDMRDAMRFQATFVLTLRYSTLTHFRQARDIFGNTQITTLLSPFLMDALVDGDLVLRSSASESVGRLASLSGTNYLTSQIKDLVDQVVNNRNPNGRAGCSLAFGAIYSHVGGLAAGPLLKTTVNVLMSLINDPHPIVHFWALNALARVINAASLAYAPFVSSTLGMLLKVYLTESHEREGGTLSNSNISGDFPAYPVVCQIIDSVITVLGPDIQESSRTRALVQSLVHEFSLEDDEGISVEAIKCIQHFLMFAPEHANIPDLVKRFTGHLSSSRRPLKLASINALYQLVQKDALAMSKLGGDRLVEDLFGMLDDDPSVQGVRNVISSWLQQTVIYNPSAWIDLCQRIMARTTASQQVADAATGQNLRDDEGESLNVGLSQDSKGAGRSRLTSRWRTQLFALQCLHEICTIVSNSGRKEHLNAIIARNQGIPASGMLFSRVSDLIKMAFTASTAYVTEIRLAGLVVLRDVIEMFATSPDPAYDDALLLEQHQAPITAALTPAFSSDSTPEILASAVHACAVFVGCGVVKDIGRMGRILKLLITALEQSKDSKMVSLGEAGELSPNASAMLRISTLSAWAQLQVSSVRQEYLQNVVKPYQATLSSLWIAALRDYASIRIDSEFLHDTSSVVDSSYSSLGKEVLLPYYSEAWAIILQAVATAMQANDPHILAAMDGKEYSEPGRDLILANDRKEPTAFFFVIFGLVYEALATSSADSSTTTAARQSGVTSALQALKCLVRPQYSGTAIMEPTIFEEFISLCYRMGMTESAGIQVHLVEMLAVFAASHSSSAGSDALTLTSPAAHYLRICAHILKQSTALSRASSAPFVEGQLSDRILVISTCVSAFASIAATIPTSQREDVRGVAILLYNLLKDESSEIDLIGPTLPALKTLLDLPVVPEQEEKERYSRLIHALLSACLLNIDMMRGRHGGISNKKIKNNMLAAVLILTVVPSWVKIGRAVVEHGCFLISQKLLDADEASLLAFRLLFKVIDMFLDDPYRSPLR